MNILFAASEAEPFAKTGGLADIIGSLPSEIATLVKEKHQGKVACVLPKYSAIDTTKFPLERLPGRFLVPVGDSFEEGIVWVYKKSNGVKNLSIYFIENKKYFDRKGLYHEGGKDYPDNAERFIFFSRSILEFCKFVRFKPAIIHCHDWQTGLVPAMLKHNYATDPYFSQTKTVFTIHNLAYQGLFPKDSLPLAHLPWSTFVTEKLEYFGSVSTLKAGIVYSDKVTTVSPTYAKEILTVPEMGKGMTGVIQDRVKDFSGILNGISYNEWNPEKDPHLAQNYSLKSKDLLIEKKKCKEDLQKAMGLPVDANIPLIGVVSRLDRQKGFHYLAPLLEKISLDKIDCQWAILGVGDNTIENELSVLAIKYPNLFKVHFDFSPEVAHKIYAGSDFFFMPSEFEPCGLSQMIALKYGAVPLVSPRGGLLDTIEDWDDKKSKGTGFISKEVSVSGFTDLLKRALEVFKQPYVLEKLIKNGMAQDFSWGTRALSYLKLYESCFSFRKKIIKKGRSWIDGKMILWTLLLTLLISLLFILRSEGTKVLDLNRDALVLEVFSRTDLDPAQVPELEEKLKTFSEVKTVVVTSPEESLNKLENDPNLGIDLNWLKQKKEQLKNSNTILPWSYDCHLSEWDEAHLTGLIKKIEEIRLGGNSVNPILEIHYDKERWSFALSLKNYLKWINTVLFLSTFLLLTGFVGPFIDWVRTTENQTPLMELGRQELFKKYGQLLVLAVVCGMGVHAMIVVAYALSFSPSVWSFQFVEFIPLEMFYALLFLLNSRKSIGTEVEL